MTSRRSGRADATTRCVALGLALQLGACASSPWEAYPESLYAVLRDESSANVRAHRALLGRILESAEQGGRKPPPGIAAEYAYYSWRVGAQDEARAAIQKERTAYPESEKFLVVLERFLPSLPAVEGGAEDGT